MFKEEGKTRPIKRLTLFFIDWLFPKECVACGEAGEWLCPKCRLTINFLPQQSCLICGLSNSGAICARHNFALDGAVAAVSYREVVVKRLIKVCKYQLARDLAPTLAEIMVSGWHDYGSRQLRAIGERGTRWLAANKTPMVVAVPLSRRRYNWRGFNQAELLAREVAKHFNWPFFSGLVKTKHTKPQVDLDSAARRINLSNCFVWRGNALSQQSVLLIDDVATTGATLNECARALKAAGAREVWGLVVAK